MSEELTKPAYEAPSIAVVGTLHGHTLRGKSLGTPNDGDYLDPGHRSLTTVS